MIDPHPTIGRAINVEFGVNLLMHISYTYFSTHNKLVIKQFLTTICA